MHYALWSLDPGLDIWNTTEVWARFLVDQTWLHPKVGLIYGAAPLLKNGLSRLQEDMAYVLFSIFNYKSLSFYQKKKQKTINLSHSDQG